MTLMFRNWEYSDEVYEKIEGNYCTLMKREWYNNVETKRAAIYYYSNMELNIINENWMLVSTIMSQECYSANINKGNG